MACGSCQKRKEEFLRKQNELKNVKIETPIQTPKPVVKTPEWKFAKIPREPKKTQVESHNHLIALKNAERIKNKLEEIKAQKTDSTLPSLPNLPPYRKTN
jgi:hypothetical protein